MLSSYTGWFCKANATDWLGLSSAILVSDPELKEDPGDQMLF